MNAFRCRVAIALSVALAGCGACRPNPAPDVLYREAEAAYNRGERVRALDLYGRAGAISTRLGDE